MRSYSFLRDPADLCDNSTSSQEPAISLPPLPWTELRPPVSPPSKAVRHDIRLLSAEAVELLLHSSQAAVSVARLERTVGCREQACDRGQQGGQLRGPGCGLG